MVARRAFLLSLAVGALVSFAAGCGDDEDEDDTTAATVTETATTATTETDAETTETTAETGSRGPAFFSTPSENIACHMSAKFVRCDIARKDWRPTPAPEPCELDYGNGIELDATHAEFTCAGDTTLGAPDTLPYGESSARGPFVCESEEDGVTCSHTGNGAGFFISRQSFRIF